MLDKKMGAASAKATPLLDGSRHNLSTINAQPSQVRSLAEEAWARYVRIIRWTQTAPALLGDPGFQREVEDAHARWSRLYLAEGSAS